MSTGRVARHLRLRRTPALRALLRESTIEARRLVAPLFVTDDDTLVGPIEGIPRTVRHRVDDVADAARALAADGLGGILLFGVPRTKDADATGAWHDDGVVCRALRAIAGTHVDLALMADVCRCQFTPDGQCGIEAGGRIDARATAEWVARTSVACARAGAQLVAPSGMIDGAVDAIRRALDEEGHLDVGILAYAVKHASALYGPFRGAARSSPLVGDRRAHQLDPANAREALREAQADLEEGADILMVKPALTNLDTLVRLRIAHPQVPLAAFEVSGEFAMVEAAAERGWLEARAVGLESLVAIIRAGADFVITYRAREVAQWLREGADASSAGRGTTAPLVDDQPAVRPSLAARVFDSVFDLLPDEANPSPLVRIHRLNPASGFSLHAKLEWMNPLGSLKDRAAWEMLRDLEARGAIGNARPGRGLVEPTSGNTGLSLAAMASARGYALRAIVPNRVPSEKKLLLRIAGAELEVINDELCPMPGLGDGSINLAKSHARAQPERYVMPNQYANPANVAAHVRTTGPEIWRQTRGTVTHIFVTLGTAGTATGLAMFLRSRNPAIRVIAVQPSEGHDVPGLRNVSQLDATELFDATLIDEIIEVDFELAYPRALDLARQEALLAGPSSGLLLEGTRQFLLRDPAIVGVGVMLFPDNVFKYAATMARHLPDLERGTTL